MGLHEEPTYLSKDDDLTVYSLYYFAKYFIQNQPDFMKTGVENQSYIDLFSPTPPRGFSTRRILHPNIFQAICNAQNLKTLRTLVLVKLTKKMDAFRMLSFSGESGARKIRIQGGVHRKHLR